MTVIANAKPKNGFKASECVCKCGNHKIVANNLLRAGFVKSCGCLISYWEDQIDALLKEKNVNYKRQYSFKDLRGPKNGLLKFDFAIFDDNNNLKCLIEYQGSQHDEEVHGNPEYGRMQREITDDWKRKYCLSHNIQCYEIWYYQDVFAEMRKILGE